MSLRLRARHHSLSDDSEEANGNQLEPEATAETELGDLDWDSFSTALEHRLAAVGIT